MADEDVIVAEVEAPPIEPNNPIADFLKSVEDQKYTDAEKQFNDMVTDRLQTQMDQAKMKIASAIYGDEEVEAAQDEVATEIGDLTQEDDEDEDIVVDGTLDDIEDDDDYPVAPV